MKCSMEKLNDWRKVKGFYPVTSKCCVCQQPGENGMEPRFLYTVCEEHSDTPPVEVSRAVESNRLSEKRNGKESENTSET